MVEQYHLSALDPGSLDSDGTKRYATDMKEKYIFLATQPQTFKENRIS